MKKIQQNPGFTRLYEGSENTIAKKCPEQANHALFHNLNLRNNSTMVFKSNAPRFNDKVVDEETYIGPGYYDQKSGFEQSRNKLNGSR